MSYDTRANRKKYIGKSCRFCGKPVKDIENFMLSARNTPWNIVPLHRKCVKRLGMKFRELPKPSTLSSFSEEVKT